VFICVHLWVNRPLSFLSFSEFSVSLWPFVSRSPFLLAFFAALREVVYAERK
jgi:hypothetical protein